MVLYENLLIQLTDEIKSQASMHGAKFKDVDDAKNPSTNQMMFKHPDAYKDMSEEEKQEMTARMMKFHKGWSQKSFKKKG